VFNLLMSAAEGTWDEPTWVIQESRFLEYTHDAIKDKFKNLNDDVIDKIKTFPALFCYESYVNAPAKVGQITEIQRRFGELKITFSIQKEISEIPYAQLFQMFPDIDVNPHGFEINRHHWAIKDVNLIEVLKKHGFVKDQVLLSQPRPPKIFITYSWDSPEHKQWVAAFAGTLRHNGLDVTLDQWHLRGGEDMSVFMERSIREADRVLVICSANYCRKARERVGGVGYESHILTNEILQQMDTTKFVPIIRSLPDTNALPPALQGRYYFNLDEGEAYNSHFHLLLRELHNAPMPIPPIGTNPFL